MNHVRPHWMRSSALLLLMLLFSWQTYGQPEPTGPPEEEQKADLVIRVRLVQAENGAMEEWPATIQDVKKTITTVGRYERYRYIEGHRIPATFDEPREFKLQKGEMRVELRAEKKGPKGYPLKLTWIKVQNGKETKILECPNILSEQGKLFQMYLPSADSLPMGLVIDVAPPWEKDPIIPKDKKGAKKE